MEIYCFCAIFAFIFNTDSAWAYQNKLVVDCLNKPFNNGKYLVNTSYAYTSRGWRTQLLRGTCQQGTLQIYNLSEQIRYAWIKGESFAWAYFKVTSQQMVNGMYMYETWSYKQRSAFRVSSSIHTKQEILNISGFPTFIRCDGKDGRDKNGYCELAGPKPTLLNTWKTPFTGTVQNIQLQSEGDHTAFQYLKYIGLFAGGKLYGKYWDYRNNKWNSEPCFTFEAYFSDQSVFEVTLPVVDFFFRNNAKHQAERILRVLGKTPAFSRSWLKTIAINGDGEGARAGFNSARLSMTLNLAPWVIRNAYKLFLHEGAHVGSVFVDIVQSDKWKRAQGLDPLFISTHAKDNPNSEDVPESFVPWMKVKKHPNSLQSQLIKWTIPNRLAVFDDLICSNYPSFC